MHQLIMLLLFPDVVLTYGCTCLIARQISKVGWMSKEEDRTKITFPMLLVFKKKLLEILILEDEDLGIKVSIAHGKVTNY